MLVLHPSIPNTLKKVSSIKKLLKKLNLFCGQQTPIVRISSLVMMMMMLVSHWLICTTVLLCYVLLFQIFLFYFICVCACGCVHDKLAQYAFILLQ